MAGMSACLRDDVQGLGGQRDAKVRSGILAALHGLARNGPDIAVDLLFVEEAEWLGSRPCQDQEPQGQMCDATVTE